MFTHRWCWERERTSRYTYNKYSIAIQPSKLAHTWSCLKSYPSIHYIPSCIYVDFSSSEQSAGLNINELPDVQDDVITEQENNDAGNEEDDADEEEEAVPEKLTDNDDERKEKWYRRAFFTLFPKLRRGRSKRFILASQYVRGSVVRQWNVRVSCVSYHVLIHKCNQYIYVSWFL